MKKTFKHLVAVAAVFGLTTAASAHRMWLLPSTFTLSGEEQWVTVDGAISNDLFFPNHVPMSLSNILVVAPDGGAVSPENGATGKFRTTFDVKLDRQGTYRIAEEAATYFAQWQEDGERKRMRGSLDQIMARGIPAREGASLMTAQRRTETYVTLGAPTDAVFKGGADGLYLVPVTHPNDVYVGEEVVFRLTLDGKAAAGLDVEIVKGQDRYRDSGGVIKTKTEADGSVRFTLSEPGRYWLSTSAAGGTVEEQGQALARRMSYNLTFEALAN
jgi:hypothetical protein